MIQPSDSPRPPRRAPVILVLKGALVYGRLSGPARIDRDVSAALRTRLDFASIKTTCRSGTDSLVFSQADGFRWPRPAPARADRGSGKPLEGPPTYRRSFVSRSGSRIITSVPWSAGLPSSSGIASLPRRMPTARAAFARDCLHAGGAARVISRAPRSLRAGRLPMGRPYPDSLHDRSGREPRR